MEVILLSTSCHDHTTPLLKVSLHSLHLHEYNEGNILTKFGDLCSYEQFECNSLNIECQWYSSRQVMDQRYLWRTRISGLNHFTQVRQCPIDAFLQHWTKREREILRRWNVTISVLNQEQSNACSIAWKRYNQLLFSAFGGKGKFSLADVSVNQKLSLVYSPSISSIDAEYSDPWYFSDRSIVFWLSCRWKRTSSACFFRCWLTTRKSSVFSAW